VTIQQTFKTETVEYKVRDVPFTGSLAYDRSRPGRRPGVLLAHGSKGLDDLPRKRALQLARMGYISFTLDLVGADLLKDPVLLKERAEAGLKALRTNRLVESGRIAAVGYGSGGAAALMLAHSGVELRAAAVFHTLLPDPRPLTGSKSAAKVLVLHGVEDRVVPPESVLSLQKELRATGSDWQLVFYGNAGHGFSETGSTDYHEETDKRSWAAMSAFFEDVLR